MEAFWDAGQFLRLAGVYLCLLVPFLCAATALCLAFARHGDAAPRLYAADILGAGAGGLGVVGLLFLLPPMRALAVLGGLGLLAAALVQPARRWSGWVFLGGGLALAVLPATWVPLLPSEYKDLSQSLRVMGAQTVAEASGPLGVLAVVASPQVPLRHAPGLSLSVEGEPPEQLGVFVDGDGPSPITRYDGRREPLAYLDGLTSALPYRLLDRPRVLVLGAGGGAGILQALYHRAAAVDAVELNPQLVALVEKRFADFSGRPYSRPGVTAHLAEARGFVAGSRAHYDLIQFDQLDGPGTAGAGLGAPAENYLYTVEALREYLHRLAPGGLLAVTRGLNLPPRDLLKLAATAIAALEAEGVAEPGRRMALIRGWKTGSLLVKNGELSEIDAERIRAFCRERSFDLDWLPGIRAEETNR